MDKTTHPQSPQLTISLLCVEDDDDDWAELQSLLALTKTYTEFDMIWDRCKSMRQAKVEVKSGRYDVILLDLKLVDSANPLDTTRTMFEVAGPLGIPIVIISGFRDDPVITRECSMSGAFQHLQKGYYDELTLLSAITISYERNQELQRQRDLYLDAQRHAVANLELAEQAMEALSRLRSDLQRFAKNDRSRRWAYSLLVAALVFCAFPSLEWGMLKFKVTNEGITLFLAAMGFIWGQGTFHERLRQGTEAIELTAEIRNRKNNDEN